MPFLYILVFWQIGMVSDHAPSLWQTLVLIPFKSYPSLHLYSAVDVDPLVTKTFPFSGG